MARTAIAITAVGTRPNLYTAAITLTNGDASNHHSFVNDGRTRLRVRNSSGGATTVTVSSVADSVTGRLGDIAVSVADGAEREFGPFPPSLFNQSTGVVNVDLSAGGSNVKLSAVSSA